MVTGTDISNSIAWVLELGLTFSSGRMTLVVHISERLTALQPLYCIYCQHGWNMRSREMTGRRCRRDTRSGDSLLRQAELEALDLVPTSYCILNQTSKQASIHRQNPSKKIAYSLQTLSAHSQAAHVRSRLASAPKICLALVAPLRALPA